MKFVRATTLWSPVFAFGLRPSMCGKACLSVKRIKKGYAFNLMHIISNDNPAYYFTIVAKDRLPVFRTDKIKAVVCAAIAEAKLSGGFALYAYVIMPDHIHLITDNFLKPSNTLRYLNGIVSRRTIDYLKKNNFQSSLEKPRRKETAGKHIYSLWEHHNNTMLVTSEKMSMQKVNYINQNPVRANMCDQAEDFRWSSARFWLHKLSGDELLEIDTKKIKWREA